MKLYDFFIIKLKIMIFFIYKMFVNNYVFTKTNKYENKTQYFKHFHKTK